jgi:antirestriction protein ArdC
MNYKEAVEAKRKAMVDQLLDFIENNPTAWEAGWYKVGGTPRNGKTSKPYNGLNALWLYLLGEHKGYTDPRWVTYQQAKDLNASVKAGEKSANIFYWSWYDKKTKKPFDDATVKDMDKDERQKYLNENVRPVLKYYQVFNAAQCNNFPKLNVEQKEMLAEERARQNAKIEKIISNSAAPVNYDGGNRAYYSPMSDSIHLPEIKRFHTMQDYYATALHEIAHSTGHASRLNREMISIFGTSDYAKEELRAELASVFMQLDHDISIEGKHFENHAAYLQSWLKSVRDDQREFFAAVTDAEKISEYVGEHYLQAKEEAGKENTNKEIKTDEAVTVRANDDVYGLIYDWKGLKEENSIYTADQLKELDEAFVPEDRYDGAVAANKTYMAIRLTGKTQEETDQNVREFLTGRYNEAGDIEYIEGWYWETVDENFFTGEKNETTLEYIDRLQIPPEDLRMKEEYAIAQRQKKIDKIVDDIVNEGTENTTQGNWIINFDQFGEDEVFVRKYIDEIAEALNKREEVADVIINENGIDADYFTDYCPNIEKNAEFTQKPLVVNFYAGPGAGKTTSAMELTAALKKTGVNVEYVQEYAKELVLENRTELLADQQHVTDEQYHRLDRLRNSVDVIVTDSPVLLGIVYGGDKIDDAYRQKIRSYYDSFNNLDLQIERKTVYQTAGRIQTEAEARDLDRAIVEMLNEQNIAYQVFQNENIGDIVATINELIQEQDHGENSNNTRETVNYTELVREQVEAEYRDFQTAEMRKPASEVFANSFKINFYSELHNFLGEDIQDNLTNRDLQALSTVAPHIIGELYDYYMHSEYASINNYSDIADMIQAYNDEYHSEIVADRYNEMPYEQAGQAERQVENTREKYQLDFRLAYSNTLLLSQSLEKLGYQRDYSVEEANQRRDTAAFEAGLSYWTNEIRYIGTDGKAIEGVYGRTNNGIMLEAADITRFTTNGLTQDEANQIADVVRGFDVEVNMQQVQREETLDAEGQTLRRDNSEQAQPAEQVGQAEQANTTFYYIWWSTSSSADIKSYYVDYYRQDEDGTVTKENQYYGKITREELTKAIQERQGNEHYEEIDSQRAAHFDDIRAEQEKRERKTVMAQELQKAQAERKVMAMSEYYDRVQDLETDLRYGAISEEDYRHRKGVLDSSTIVEDSLVEQARQVEQAEQARKGEWALIGLTSEQIGNEYGNNVMIRMPQGEYSSFVFFAPKKYLRDGEDGTKKLSVRADWTYKLQNDGLQAELTGSELRAAFAGREVGKSAKRVAPRKRNRQRLSDLEANVPDEMKALKNWCVFRTKYNPETERQEKFVISPTDGKWAKSNDPDTWVDFETAIKYAEENDCAGLSFALDGKCGITCIDLDKSISKDGKLTESAEKLTQELADTYSETSVSGNGIHIFVADDILHKTYKNRADLPDGEIEVYDSARFISMTGNMRSKSNKLTKCPAATTSWLRGTLGKKFAERENKPRADVGRQNDSDVIERIRRSKRGHDFDTLMSGGAITGDKSRDDMILLNMLAFFTDCNREQMEAIFLSSGRRADLGANGEKKSSNYLSRSIEKACSSLTTRISPAAIGGAGRAGSRGR